MNWLSIGTAIIGLTVTASAQQESAWSQFRGPNGSGVVASSALPTEFDANKNVIWRTDLPHGHSSPALYGDRIFLTGSESEKLFTLCISRESGKILWRRQAPRDRVSKLDGRNSDASPTPAVDGDTVMVFFHDYGLIAYDHDGEERWHLPLGPFNNLYGMGASPILVADRVILACDQSTGSYVIAVAKSDGEVLWKVDRPRATSGHSTPIVYRPETGMPQIILPGSFLLDAYDAATGARIWWVRGLPFEMKSVPVIDGGVLYVSGYASPLNQPGNQVVLPSFEQTLAANDADHDGLISKSEMPRSRASGYFDFVDLGADGSLDSSDWAYLLAALASKNGILAIKLGGDGDMTEENILWSYHRSVPQLPSPLIYRGVLYMLNDAGGLLTTLRPGDGEVIERGRLKDGVDNYYASPVAADGKIFIVSESGIVSVLPAGGSLEALAINDLDDRCYATPAIDSGRIYLRTISALYCFGLEGK